MARRHTERRRQLSLETWLHGALGSALTHFWVPDAASVVLSGANVSTLADTHPDLTYPLAPFTAAGGSPAWNANGGPGNRPYINLPAAAVLGSNAADRASGNRQALYCVGAMPGTAVDCLLMTARAGDGLFDTARMIIGQTSGVKYRGYCTFTGSTQDVSSAATADANWHLFAIRPLSTGASWQIDGVEVSPTFTGSDTVQLIGAMLLGHPSLAGGKFAMGLTIDAPTTAHDLIIRSYVARKFLLAV